LHGELSNCLVVTPRGHALWAHDQGRRVNRPNGVFCLAGIWQRQEPPDPVKDAPMATYKVGYFVGSLSSTSINRLLAKALGRLAPPELVLTEIPIKDLPLYSPDFDADYPPLARALMQSIAEVDAVVFVTPEYN